MSHPSLFGNLFLSVGAMKAGTTWLFSVLDRHPELHFTPEKEIHYFYARYVDAGVLSDERRLDNARTRYIDKIDPKTANIDRVRHNLHFVSAYLNRPVDDYWYRNLFDLRGRATYGCDFSNFYALLPAEVWPRIAADCARLRVLYTLRHPVKRLWSHVKFHLQVTGQLELLQSWQPQDFERFARQDFIWDNAEYGRNLRNMRAGLSEDMLKVLFFEDMHADKRGTLADIERFLGVGPCAYPQPLLDKRVNESAATPMPDFFPGLFADDFERIMGELEEMGLTLPESWPG